MASFLDYTPVPLAFGTSGLRGLVKDITDLEAYINVKAALRYLLATGDVREGSRVVVAGDLRPSTDRILRATARAIVDCACAVQNAGKIPTPALAHYAISERCASVMVSGSHIPFDRNGIKLYKSVGEILKSDEAGIQHEVERVRAEEYGRTVEQSPFDSHGMLQHSMDLPALDPAAEETYVRRYLTCFARDGLRGLRIVVYQHSAVGRDILPRILRELGADVVTAGRTETFVAIDTENITDQELASLAELAREAGKSGPIDAILSTDGDSDRPLLVAVRPSPDAGSSPPDLQFLPGDLLGIVVAEYLAADAAAVPISANDAVERRMTELGVSLEKTKIGSPHVIARMDELRRAGRCRRLVGWEANGGFLVGSDIAMKAGTLAALPTRDSTLPLLCNLYAAVEQRTRLEALWSRLPARFGRSGLIDEFPTAVSQAILNRLVPSGATTEVAFDGSGGVSDTKPSNGAAGALDERAADAWRQCAQTLSPFFSAQLGFDRIVKINVLDGIRIYFDNHDVAHVRPSGNAPQLRIYANADSQARADQIVELGLREPDGVLRRLQRQFAE